MDGNPWWTRLHWRRFALPMSASPDEAKALVESLPDALPPFFPWLGFAMPPSDIGFDDGPGRREGRAGGFRPTRFDGDRFAIDHGRRRSGFGVWGRIESVPGGVVVHVELGMGSPWRWLVPAAGVLGVVAGVMQAQPPAAGIVPALGVIVWGLVGYWFVRRVDRVERAVRGHFPAPDNPHAGPFR